MMGPDKPWHHSDKWLNFNGSDFRQIDRWHAGCFFRGEVRRGTLKPIFYVRNGRWVEPALGGFDLNRTLCHA
jgi:hypothetical protein